MKRSEYVALGAIGVLLVATFWPRGGTAPAPNDPALDVATQGSGFTTLAFASLDECRQSQAVTEQTCSAEFGKAQQATVADAPKYNALADCEAEYGASQCRPATWNGASVFIPALAGVLIARGIAGAVANSQPLYPPRTGPQSCPPGFNPQERPECQARSGSSASSSSSSSSSGRSYYSTGGGRTVGRVAGAVIADMVLPSRTNVSRTTSLPGGGSWGNVPTTRPSTTTSSRSSSSSSSSSWSSSSSSTSSRGGFGSTASSSSSSFGS